VQLGEGAGDDDVAGCPGQFQTVLEGGVAGELGIGAVQHQQDVARQLGVQAADLGARQPGAGRIAGVGQVDDLRPFIDGLEQFVDAQAIAGLRRVLHLRLGRAGGDGVGGEGVFALHDVVARLQEDQRQQIEELVRTRAEDQALGLEAEAGGDGLTQRRGLEVGIGVQVGEGGGEGRAGRLAGAQRILVGRQLDRMGHATAVDLPGA
jgi:hypothetical protein